MVMVTESRAPSNDTPGQTRPRSGKYRLGLPFLVVHLSCVLVVVVGVSTTAVVVAVVSYALRMFGITAFFHRCFSHRAFRTGRRTQFVGAFLGAAAAQRGPLWWAAHHRVHHRRTDRPGDPHSPRIVGLLRSHTGWQFEAANEGTDLALVADLAAFPELRFLDRYPYVAPASWIAGLLVLGGVLGAFAPSLGTSPAQLAVWGFSCSTVALWHATFLVNSAAHRFGRQRFALSDDSRNTWWVAILTFGEGWHNNHHRFPSGARQGLARYEIDLTWTVLCVMRKLGLVRDVRPTPPAILSAARTRAGVHPAR
jgi:stearoyl-CoA desaturase (delta-9 desaturase)